MSDPHTERDVLEKLKGIIAELREENERLREKLQLEIARRDLTIGWLMRELDLLQELVARPRG